MVVLFSDNGMLLLTLTVIDAVDRMWQKGFNSYTSKSPMGRQLTELGSSQI